MSKEHNISQEEFERIENYLDGSMPALERSRFELDLQENSLLRDRLEEVKSLRLGIESAVLKEQLEGFHSELGGSPSKYDSESLLPTFNSRRKRIRWIAAASIIILIGAFFLRGMESSTEKLFAKHFVPDPGLATHMGSSDNFEFYDGMVDYKQGKYSQAIDKWNKLVISKPNNDTLTYFIGVAHLAAGDEKEAIRMLKDLSTTSGNSFENETLYYLGLAYLKSDDTEEAKKYLTFSSTESAKRILSELNN